MACQKVKLTEVQPLGPDPPGFLGKFFTEPLCPVSSYLTGYRIRSPRRLMGKQMLPLGTQGPSSSAENSSRGCRSSSRRALCPGSGVGTVLGSLPEGRLVQGSILTLPGRLPRQVQPAPLVLGLPPGLLSPSTPEIRPCFPALPPEQRAGLWEA